MDRHGADTCRLSAPWICASTVRACRRARGRTAHRVSEAGCNRSGAATLREPRVSHGAGRGTLVAAWGFGGAQATRSRAACGPVGRHGSGGLRGGPISIVPGAERTERGFRVQRRVRLSSPWRQSLLRRAVRRSKRGGGARFAGGVHARGRAVRLFLGLFGTDFRKRGTRGCLRQPRLARMVRGAPCAGREDWIYGIAGFELG